jgi:protein translocase SEC61 complex gamma subunit
MVFNIDVKEKIAEYRRVLQVARKPNQDEFKHIAKICGLGIIVIGLIGFVTYAASILFIG